MSNTQAPDALAKTFPREEIARLLLEDAGFEFEGESLCEEADRIFSDAHPRIAKAVGLADRIAERLTTLRNQSPPAPVGDVVEQAAKIICPSSFADDDRDDDRETARNRARKVIALSTAHQGQGEHSSDLRNMVATAPQPDREGMLREALELAKTTIEAIVNGTPAFSTSRQLGGVLAELEKALVQPPQTTAAPDLMGVVYLADRFKWAAPGDQQKDVWLVRFCDNDIRDMVFTGPEAEAEAWSKWNAHAPGYNMYVFRLASLPNQPHAAQSDAVRSLETAPKDGTYFLMVGDNFDGGAAVVHWDDDWWMLDDGKNFEIPLRAEYKLRGWLPLPAAIRNTPTDTERGSTKDSAPFDRTAHDQECG